MSPKGFVYDVVDQLGNLMKHNYLDTSESFTVQTFCCDICESDSSLLDFSADALLVYSNVSVSDFHADPMSFYQSALSITEILYPQPVDKSSHLLVVAPVLYYQIVDERGDPYKEIQMKRMASSRDYTWNQILKDIMKEHKLDFTDVNVYRDRESIDVRDEPLDIYENLELHIGATMEAPLYIVVPDTVIYYQLVDKRGQAYKHLSVQPTTTSLNIDLYGLLEEITKRHELDYFINLKAYRDKESINVPNRRLNSNHKLEMDIGSTEESPLYIVVPDISFSIILLDANREELRLIRSLSLMLSQSHTLQNVIDAVLNFMQPENEKIMISYIMTHRNDTSMYATKESMEPISSVGESTENTLFLVISPKSDISIIPNENEAFARYLNRGNLIKADEKTNMVISRITELQTNFSFTEIDLFKPIPFILLAGSSGMGKTQMAFNLKAAGLPVYYLLADDSMMDQPIYQSYANCTITFLSCVKQDMVDPDLHHLSFCLFHPVIEFFVRNNELRFRTFGFILSFLKKLKYCGAPASRQQVLDYLITLKEKPVIFLDEFPCSTGDDDSLRFRRNIFRSLNLVTIVASKHGSSAKLFPIVRHSRGNTEVYYHWCIATSRFPGYIPDDTLSNEFLNFLLQNSRPFFSTFTKDYISNNPIENIIEFMDELCHELYNETVRYKASSTNAEYFLAGQTTLLLSASEIDHKTKHGDHRLVNCHFANLIEKDMFDMYMTCSTLWTKNGNRYNEWKHIVKFPELENDVLLYLSLMGGKNYDSLIEDGETISFYESLDHIPDETVFFQNPVQETRDVLYFEAMISASIILASHCNGFAGIELNAFLARLAFEVGMVSQQVTLTINENIQQKTIPFLSPPNQSWPEILKNTGLNLDDFARTRNVDRIDFKSGTLTGECKNHRGPLEIDTIRDILERVPKDSQLHLVLTNKIREPKFKKKQIEAFLKKARHLRNHLICELKYNPRSSELELVDLCETNNSTKRLRRDYDKLVIFIPIRHYEPAKELLDPFDTNQSLDYTEKGMKMGSCLIQ